MKNIRKLLALLLIMTMILSLSACGNKKQTNDDKIQAPVNETVQNNDDKQVEDANNSEENSDSTVDEPQMPTELVDKINEIIEITANGGDITEYVADVVDEEKVESKYYDSELIMSAMNKNTIFEIFTKSDTVNIENSTKISKNEWEVEISNEMGNKGAVRFVKIDGVWMLNIHQLMSIANVEVPLNVSIKLNGQDVPREYIIKSDKHDTYNIPGVLDKVTNILEYDTGMSESYSKEFIAGSAKPVTMVYELTQSDLDTLLPKVEELWVKVRDAAANDDAVTIQELLTNDSLLDANSIATGMKDNSDRELMSFSKRTDTEAQKAENVCYMTSANRYRLNLVGKLSCIAPGLENVVAPTDFNFIEVEIQSDGSLKIQDASDSVWLREVNPYSKDG